MSYVIIVVVSVVDVVVLFNLFDKVINKTENYNADAQQSH